MNLGTGGQIIIIIEILFDRVKTRIDHVISSRWPDAKPFNCTRPHQDANYLAHGSVIPRMMKGPPLTQIYGTVRVELGWVAERRRYTAYGFLVYASVRTCGLWRVREGRMVNWRLYY